MEITVTKEGNAAMLSLGGSFEAEDAEKFASAVAQLGEITDLALDLDGLVYLSTAGLAEIVRVQKKMEGKGSFSLVRVPGDVSDLFRMTGLYGRMDLYEKD